ncbi:ORF-120 [Agrotis segetum nucleopolyhedrovirus A]|uniref:ORF-120 n=1 Tax=Agrotis segetum nuclear polyhedrosis virus TaxID=1962501 RepID=Q287F2_NPVAS|nr:ORF-120 [Agrotis segetum nucleopolyhedrovirus A]AAZ38286.1 ORF-120 [Agrotis segetum nucleopolyhedrovirus A]
MSRVTRSGSMRPAQAAALAVVSPRKRPKPPTPPTTRRSATEKTRSQSSAASSTTSNTSSDARVAAKVGRKDMLYYVNLDKEDYYSLLNVGRNATRADIKASANNIMRIYKKRPDTDGGNSYEAIQNTIGNAVQVLSNFLYRNIYNRHLDEKLKIQEYTVEKVKPLQKTVTEIYNAALRLQNDAAEFFEMDIGQILRQNVYNTIERTTKSKQYKTTKTNRLLVEWSVDENNLYDNGGIDENYLEKYFDNDGLVGLVMCGTRRGCAVIEVMTFKGVKAIIERETKRKQFRVRDYTEAEFGIDHTNYSPQLDRLDLLQNNLDEFERDIENELRDMDTTADVEDTSLQEVAQQLNYTKTLLDIEMASGVAALEEMEQDMDDDDDYDDYEEEMQNIDVTYED